MNNVIFDSSTVISLAMQDLLWILEPMKKMLDGEFYVCEAVKREVVDKPLTGKKFKYEALFIMNMFEKGILKLYHDDLSVETNKLMFLCNHAFKAEDWIKLVDEGEVQSLALALKLNAAAYFVDERTMRLLIEDPKLLYALLKKKLHTKVDANRENVIAFKKLAGNINVLRSSELILRGYELGLFDKFIFREDMRKVLLDGLLWGTKLRGCSISGNEIDDALRLEKL